MLRSIGCNASRPWGPGLTHPGAAADVLAVGTTDEEFRTLVLRTWKGGASPGSSAAPARRRQAMRAWLIGSDILEQVLASPKLVRVIRKASAKHAAQLLDEDLLKGQGLVPTGEPGA